jgi:hypothetical protein
MEFPALKVRDLEGTDYVIPHGLPGGPHVIIVAFQQWHQALVNRWVPGLTAMAERHPGMEIWEVPSISQGYRLFRGGIDGGMRAGIPDADTRRHTLTAYTDIRHLARDLEIDSVDTIHVFLVDCTGSVLWRAEGEPTDVALAELEAVVPNAC